MSTDLAVIEAALEAAKIGPLEVIPPEPVATRPADCYDVWAPEGPGFIAESLTYPDAHLIANAPTWLAELVERVKVAEAAVERVRAESLAQGWEERDKARAQYLGPDHGHYEGCMGYEDCYCGTYPNPYRAEEPQL